MFLSMLAFWMKFESLTMNVKLSEVGNYVNHLVFTITFKAIYGTSKSDMSLTPH